jgi:hypothetical protein
MFDIALGIGEQIVSKSAPYRQYAGECRDVIAGPAARARLTLVDRYDAGQSPSRHERETARNRRLAIYAAIYSVAGLLTVGNFLFWWLE